MSDKPTGEWVAMSHDSGYCFCGQIHAEPDEDPCPECGGITRTDSYLTPGISGGQFLTKCDKCSYRYQDGF